MKIRKILLLLDAIENIQKTAAARKAKFGFILAFNKRILETIKIDIQESLKDENDSIIQQYDNDRIELLRKYCQKDEHGDPLIKDNKFIIDDDNISLIYKEINEKYPNYFAMIQEKQNKINELLEENIEINLKKIKIEDFPDIPDEIYPNIMDIFLEMIE